MHYNTFSSLEASQNAVKENKAVLFFFSTLKCSLGEALEPKVYQLLKEEYPKISFYFIDMQTTPIIAAHYSVFVEPTILIFFDGKETIRKSRNIGIDEFSKSISRIYKIIFD